MLKYIYIYIYKYKWGILNVQSQFLECQGLRQWDYQLHLYGKPKGFSSQMATAFDKDKTRGYHRIVRMVGMICWHVFDLFANTCNMSLRDPADCKCKSLVRIRS